MLDRAFTYQGEWVFPSLSKLHRGAHQKSDDENSNCDSKSLKSECSGSQREEWNGCCIPPWESNGGSQRMCLWGWCPLRMSEGGGGKGRDLRMKGSMCIGAEMWLGVRLSELGFCLIHWLGCGVLWIFPYHKSVSSSAKWVWQTCLPCWVVVLCRSNEFILVAWLEYPYVEEVHPFTSWCVCVCVGGIKGRYLRLQKIMNNGVSCL